MKGKRHSKQLGKSDDQEEEKTRLRIGCVS